MCLLKGSTAPLFSWKSSASPAAVTEIRRASSAGNVLKSFHGRKIYGAFKTEDVAASLGRRSDKRDPPGVRASLGSSG